MSLTEVALTFSLVAIATFGIAGIVGRNGYSFDLRRKSRRKDARTGGRRAEDKIATAQ